MNKRVLDELSAFLKKNNMMIFSPVGEISLVYDVHGSGREMFSTGSNCIYAYDAELLWKERGEAEDDEGEGGGPPAKEDVWEEFQDGCPKRKDDYLGGGLYIQFCTLCIDKRGDYHHCTENSCPLIYLKKFMEKS